MLAVLARSTIEWVRVPSESSAWNTEASVDHIFSTLRGSSLAWEMTAGTWGNGTSAVPDGFVLIIVPLLNVWVSCTGKCGVCHGKVVGCAR